MKFQRKSFLLFIALILTLSAHSAFAQDRSEDRDKPTPVAGNEVSDDLDGSDDAYYYVFTAGAGTLKITFEVEAAGTNAGANFDFFDAKNNSVLSNVLVQGVDKGSERVTKTIKSAKPRDIVMRVKGIKYGSSGGNGMYKVKFDGPMGAAAAPPAPAPPVEQPAPAPPPPVEKPADPAPVQKPSEN